MKISGSYTFNAPQDEVWALLMDPQVISKAIPGVENFTTVGENDYEAQIKLGIGAISGQYAGRVTITDVQPPTHYKMNVGGKGQRGFVNGAGEINLEPQADKTVVHYTGDANLGGQLAGIGQRLVEGAARTIINQGFKSLEGQLVERRAAAAALAPAPAPEPEVAPAPPLEVAPTIAPEAVAPPPAPIESAPVAPEAAAPEPVVPAPVVPAPVVPAPVAPVPATRPTPSAPVPAAGPAVPITWVILGAIIIIILLILLFRPT